MGEVAGRGHCMGKMSPINCGDGNIPTQMRGEKRMRVPREKKDLQVEGTASHPGKHRPSVRH
jgi:hypothetical protein